MLKENELMESVVGFEALYNSMKKCKNGVLWKAPTAHFYLNEIEETLKLEKELKEETYIPKPPNKFTLTSPKKREAVSIVFRDRVYQRSLNDNAIYDAITKSFIYDNCACQRGKGTDFARSRLDLFLHKFYRKYGLDGYVLQCDIKGYYPNMRHSVAEKLFKEKLPPEIYKLAERVLEDQYDGEIGYNPGSQMVQIIGIAVLNELDHYIKEQLHIKFYLRYMDDFILIHHDKEYLEYCLIEIQKKLDEIEMKLHPKKTKIYSIEEPILFLGFYNRLTKTGKVVKTINSDNVRREKRKLRRMVALVKKGRMKKEKVDQCFESWKAHASKGDSFKLIQRMNKYYKKLWEVDDYAKKQENAISARCGCNRKA